MRALPLLAAGCLLFCQPLYADKQWQEIDFAVHVHTQISTGELTAQEAADAALAAGLGGVIFTDSLLRRWEYGFWPLQAWIKKVVEQPSVRSFGATRYLREIQLLNRPDAPLAIAGIEAAPFYYWRRNPLHKLGGEIRDWNQHLLIFGLDKPKQLESLPVDAIDPYHGEKFFKPYQEFIDAAAGQGGLVFWAHPFVKHEGAHGGIADSTESYPHLLESTEGYHGFAITYLGYLDAVGPGMLWDRLLSQYTEGKRDKPAWVIGESDWRSAKERPLGMVVTSVFVSERSPQSVLDAVREGRMWARIRANGSAPLLSEFTVLDESSGKRAISGNHVTVDGGLTIRIAGKRPRPAQGKLKLTLVKDGMILYEEETEEPSFIRQWPDRKPVDVSYYRLIIEDPSGVIYTNPIFVRPKI